MPHPADFVDAYHRQWADAELLFANDCWANADQLYGFSAECGLKAVMKTLGMPVDETGIPEEREHRVHVQDLWPISRSLSVIDAGRGICARFRTVRPSRTGPDTEWYLQRFREKSWNLFRDGLYGTVEPAGDAGDPYSFDLDEHRTLRFRFLGPAGSPRARRCSTMVSRTVAEFVGEGRHQREGPCANSWVEPSSGRR